MEGIDFGDDMVMDCFSMFMVMLFFVLNVFVLNVVGNSDIGFFYCIVCLCDLVFKDKYVLLNFFKFWIVLRSELDFFNDDKICNEIFKCGREKV